jgi:hypothetical protein
MMNVKETLKRLHKRLPTLSLDELFELLDCYVEQSATFPNWELGKIWYSTDTTGVNETAKVTCVTNNTDPGIYTVNTNLPHGKIKYYDGGGSTQLVAEH